MEIRIKTYAKRALNAWAVLLLVAAPFLAILPSVPVGATMNEPPCAATTKKM